MNGVYVDKQGRLCIDKSPGSTTLDYIFRWAAWLAGDTIKSTSVTVEDGKGVTVSYTGHTDTEVSVFITGGVISNNPLDRVAVTCSIETNSSPARKESFTLYLNIVRK